ncbi:unnamed protein product [Ranitomeya imitator]|uniref:Inter-alpha-trypsin inhibitor heavy chain C-terminal domain-containing protein n=1 Tax=Ranitomeya imitator TaxID=111125 RepID=A0ABN9KTV0_9NEOB|nr:unnamed protein product [Ranitomeya imitator]
MGWLRGFLETRIQLLNSRNFIRRYPHLFSKTLCLSTHQMESLSDMTNNRFHHYFGGDEIVVAGKVDPEKKTPIESFITATSADDVNFLLETISEIEALNDFFAQSKHAFPDFAKQYWAQLTINQLLAERNLATTAEAKRNLTKRIMQLSITHHFVTPFTSLLIESEDGKEKMLADSPNTLKGACCQTLAVSTKTTPAPPAPTVTKELECPPPVLRTPLELRADPTESITVPPNCKNNPNAPPNCVDNDPHFIINLPKSQTDVCFNIDAQAGSILNMMSDPKLGITINGKIVTAKKTKDGKLNTYFGTFGLYFQQLNTKIEVSTEKITVKDPSHTREMKWSESSTLTYNRLVVSMKKESNITVTVDNDLSFLIVLHRVWKDHPVNVDFLGLYFPSSDTFSDTAHGLIGQFMKDPEISVYDLRPGTIPEKPIATMNVKGKQLTVTRGVQKEFHHNRINGTSVTCWFVHNSGKGFIDGHYKDYIVPQLYSFLKLH